MKSLFGLYVCLICLTCKHGSWHDHMKSSQHSLYFNALGTSAKHSLWPNASSNLNTDI